MPYRPIPMDIATKEIHEGIINVIYEKKGNNIVSVEFTPDQNNICDFFIIADAENTRHTKSIANNIIDEIKNKYRIKPYHIEGFENGEWILIDYIDIVVHIFLKEKRDFYDIEGLWADAKFTNY